MNLINMEVKLSKKEKSLIYQYMIGAGLLGMVIMSYIIILTFNNYTVVNTEYPAIVDLHLQNPSIFFGWVFTIIFIFLAKYITQRFYIAKKELEQVVKKQNMIITNNALFAKSIGEGNYSYEKVQEVEQKDLLTR